MEEAAAEPVCEPWKPAPEPLEEPVAEADDDATPVPLMVGRDMVVLRLMETPVPAEMVPVMLMVALGEADMVIMDEPMEFELGYGMGTMDLDMDELELEEAEADEEELEPPLMETLGMM